MYGISYLKSKLAKVRGITEKRYSYYEMKNNVVYPSVLIPPEYNWLTHTLGWCTKAVDSVADRLNIAEFRNDDFFFSEMFELNNSDVLFDSGILSALIAGCSFVYISMGPEEFPVMQIIDGNHATGILDDSTFLLKEGYAVLQYDENDEPLLEAYFEPGKTTYYPKGEEPYEVKNPALYPLLVPLIYRHSAKKPFGSSRISHACMSIQQMALRTLKRSEIGAEFNAIPQKYILGLSSEAEFNGRVANYSRFLALDKDDDGDRPVVGQFQQQSMTPHLDMLKSCASEFSAETGLTLDDLGFPSANPSSAESIKAVHETLRLTCENAKHGFTVGFKNAGYLAACLRDGKPYQRHKFANTQIVWFPTFERDLNSLGTTGDAILKIQQALPEYLTEEKIKDLIGF